jgi:hypothetical protein
MTSLAGKLAATGTTHTHNVEKLTYLSTNIAGGAQNKLEHLSQLLV